MSFSERISPLIGRLALAWFFLLSEAYTRASDWDGQVALLTFANFPAPPVLLALALLVMVLGRALASSRFSCPPRRGAAVRLYRRGNRADARLLAPQGRRRARRGLTRFSRATSPLRADCCWWSAWAADRSRSTTPPVRRRSASAAARRRHKTGSSMRARLMSPATSFFSARPRMRERSTGPGTSRRRCA